MIKRPIEAVLFDCDGTLVDDLDVHARLWPAIFQEFNIGGFDTKAGLSVGKYLKEKGFSSDKIRKFWKRFSGMEFDLEPKIFSGVNELLRILKQKGILIAIVTNRPTTRNYLQFLVQAGLDIELVDFFVNHDFIPSLIKLRPNQFSAPIGKPHLEFLRPIIKILKNIEKFPRSVLTVGDSWADLGLAKNLSSQFAGVLSGPVRSVQKWKEFGIRNRDVIFKEVSGLIKIFE